MLRLTVFEFIVRAIPEAFIYILACYTLSKNRLNIKRYIFSSILFATCMYFIRMLPINYGVHTILNIITITVILITINKIDIIPAIKSSIITFICLFITELVNMLSLSLIFKEHLEAIMENTILKTISGLPSLAMFFLITLYCYNLRKKGKF